MADGSRAYRPPITKAWGCRPTTYLMKSATLPHM